MATIIETTDAATGLDTVYNLAVGDTFTGSVAGSDEVDRILVDLQAGSTYTAILSGLFGGSSSGVIGVSNFASGVKYWSVNYASGVLQGNIADVQVNDVAENWHVTFVAPIGGEYSLFVDDNGDADAGLYSMSIVEGDGTPTPSGPTAGDDVIEGGTSDDTLNLLGGNDAYTDLGGNDTIKGGGGADTISGGAGKDKLEGGSGADTLYGGEGKDKLKGDSGADILYGGEGKDKLEGGSGKDVLHGDEGKDKLNGGGDNDTLYGGAKNDELKGGGGKDILEAGTGDDRLLGGGGKDILFGGAGKDVLKGGSGNDTLNGGDGADTLKGDKGADTFIIGGNRIDTIVDFSNGIDLIDLSGFADGSAYSVTDDESGNTVLSINGVQVAVIKGVMASTFSDENFILPNPAEITTITFDGGTITDGVYQENGFSADFYSHAFQTTKQIPFQDLDSDGNTDFGVIDQSDAVTNIDAFARIEFSQDNGDTFEFVDFELVGEGGGDADGNLILTGENDATGYIASATFLAEGDGFWDVNVRADIASGFTSLTDLTQTEMLAYFTEIDSLYIRSADGDGREAVDTGNGIGIDDLIFL